MASVPRFDKCKARFRSRCPAFVLVSHVIVLTLVVVSLVFVWDLYDQVLEFKRDFGTPRICLAEWGCKPVSEASPEEIKYEKEARNTVSAGVPGAIPAITVDQELKCRSGYSQSFQDQGVSCLVLPGTPSERGWPICVSVERAIEVAKNNGVNCTMHTSQQQAALYKLFLDQQTHNILFPLALSGTLVVVAVLTVIYVAQVVFSDRSLFRTEYFLLPVYHFWVVILMLFWNIFNGILLLGTQTFYCGGDEYDLDVEFTTYTLTNEDRQLKCEQNPYGSIHSRAFIVSLSFTIAQILVGLPIALRSQFVPLQNQPSNNDEPLNIGLENVESPKLSKRNATRGMCLPVMAVMLILTGIVLVPILFSKLWDIFKQARTLMAIPDYMAVAVEEMWGDTSWFLIFIVLTALIFAGLMALSYIFLVRSQNAGNTACREKGKVGETEEVEVEEIGHRASISSAQTGTNAKKHCEFRTSEENSIKLVVYFAMYMILAFVLFMVLVLVAFTIAIVFGLAWGGCLFILSAPVGQHFSTLRKNIRSDVYVDTFMLAYTKISKASCDSFEELGTVIDIRVNGTNVNCDKFMMGALVEAHKVIQNAIEITMISIDRGGIYCLDLTGFGGEKYCNSVVYEVCKNEIPPVTFKSFGLLAITIGAFFVAIGVATFSPILGMENLRVHRAENPLLQERKSSDNWANESNSEGETTENEQNPTII